MSQDTDRLAAKAHLLVEWLKRDFRTRYTQTVLGSLWAFVQPVALTAAFVFIFGHVARLDVGMPYASFVFPAMLLWTLFSAGVTNANQAMSASMYMAAKARYPRIVAPLAATFMPLVDFAAGLVLLPMLFAIQHPPSRFDAVTAVVSLLGTVLLAVGLGAFLSALTIFVRDVRNLLPFALQLGILITPVAYPVSRLPEILQTTNPMATYVRGLRAAFVRTEAPSGTDWAVALSISAVVAVLGVLYFERVQSRFPDVA